MDRKARRAELARARYHKKKAEAKVKKLQVVGGNQLNAVALPDVHPAVEKFATKVQKIKSPHDVMACQQQLGYLILMNLVEDKKARALGYMFQNWQMSYKAAQAEDNAIEADQHEVFESEEINGQNRPSRLIDVKKHEKFYAIVKKYEDSAPAKTAAK